MTFTESYRFALHALSFHRVRSALTALGIAIGVTAVVLLTSMGEGLNQYMVEEFAQFGTHNLRIGLGKKSTMGLNPGMLNTQRPLTIEDALAVSKLPGVVVAEPNRIGLSEVEANRRTRETTIMSGTNRMQEFLLLEAAAGRFLPEDNIIAPRAFAVLGSEIHQDLYDGESALGDKIRIGGRRFRVVGVLAPRGDVLGLNVDKSVIIPVAKALELYNANSVVEINVRYDPSFPVEEVTASITRLLIARHGVEDFNIQTQQQMLDTLGSVLDVLTVAVAALGSISLLVGGVGIFTIMTIAVRERRPEIGLLRALGSTRQQVQGLFLSEAVVLAALGGAVGLLLGGGLVLLISGAAPNLPVRLSLPYVFMAELVSVFIGIVAGVAPASRAAGLDPLEALRDE